MRKLYQILLFCILSFASSVQAGTPYCWSLYSGLLGVSSTTLKLHVTDIEDQYLVSGTASFSIITFPPVTRVRLVNGTAATVNDKIEVSLNASGIEGPEQDRLWIGTYHLVLNPATLNGTFLARPSENANSNPATSGEATLITCQ